jgi:hypothetical protein
MSDIVNELRDRSYATKAKDPLCERAADEIERLRLTAEEREVIKWFSRLSYGDGGPLPTYCATLRALLERTK